MTVDTAALKTRTTNLGGGEKTIKTRLQGVNESNGGVSEK